MFDGDHDVSPASHLAAEGGIHETRTADAVAEDHEGPFGGLERGGGGGGVWGLVLGFGRDGEHGVFVGGEGGAEDGSSSSGV